jgi:hypothetical protein
MMANDELNEMFLVHVAGFSTAKPDPCGPRMYIEDGTWLDIPDFCNDVSTVLQWLSHESCWTATFTATFHGDLYSIGYKRGGETTYFGVDASFAKAAMKSMLKARGVL